MTFRGIHISQAVIAHSGEICTERPIERSRNAPKGKLICASSCLTTHSSR